MNRDLQNPEESVENLVQETVLAINKSMDRLRIVVRVAPGLGLIGTLIPMGTGLAALGQGDMSRLTSDLVIAFTTTVVGLALGLLAYCIWTITSRWAEEDIKNIELAAEVLMKAKQDKEKKAKSLKEAEPKSIGPRMAVHQG
jgi:biopolymer transport protein ExbB/TolQ